MFNLALRYFRNLTMDYENQQFFNKQIQIIMQVITKTKTLYPLQAFFEINDVDIKWKKIRRLYPAKVKKYGKISLIVK